MTVCLPDLEKRKLLNKVFMLPQMTWNYILTGICVFKCKYSIFKRYCLGQSWSILSHWETFIVIVWLCLQPCSTMRGEVTTSRPKSPLSRSSTCRVSAHRCMRREISVVPLEHGLTVFDTFSSSCCSAQLVKLQADMEALREQRESTICTTREELCSAQEEVPLLPDLLTSLTMLLHLLLKLPRLCFRWHSRF